jgi:hypothetical protein
MSPRFRTSIFLLIHVKVKTLVVVHVALPALHPLRLVLRLLLFVSFLVILCRINAVSLWTFKKINVSGLALQGIV